MVSLKGIQIQIIAVSDIRKYITQSSYLNGEIAAFYLSRGRFLIGLSSDTRHLFARRYVSTVNGDGDSTCLFATILRTPPEPLPVDSTAIIVGNSEAIEGTVTKYGFRK